jgi:hypothetical protein
MKLGERYALALKPRGLSVPVHGRERRRVGHHPPAVEDDRQPRAASAP